MSAIQLGKLVEYGDEASRDAVHVAVVPLVAQSLIRPGSRVAISSNGEAYTTALVEDAVAIADPFLNDPIMQGDRFWALMLPGTVKDLRHHWTHPSVVDDPVGDEGEYNECKGCW